jgi:hypothetical protein
MNIDGDETIEKHGRSLKNSVEVAVIVLIVKRLFEGKGQPQSTLM